MSMQSEEIKEELNNTKDALRESEKNLNEKTTKLSFLEEEHDEL